MRGLHYPKLLPPPTSKSFGAFRPRTRPQDADARGAAASSAGPRPGHRGGGAPLRRHRPAPPARAGGGVRRRARLGQAPIASESGRGRGVRLEGVGGVGEQGWKMMKMCGSFLEECCAAST